MAFDPLASVKTLTRKLQKGQRGVGIIAAMLAIAVAGLLATGLSTMFSNTIAERKIDMTIRGRDIAYAALTEASNSPDALFVSTLESATGNQQLKRCILPGGGNDCTNTSSASAAPFRLMVPISNQLPRIAYSGLDAADLGGHYTNMGFRAQCQTGPECRYWGKTVFWAQCPNDAASCPQAFRIYVRPQILYQRNVAGAKTYNDGLVVRDRPTAQEITTNPSTGSVEVLVSDILAVAQVCPLGAYMNGVSARGQIQCKCDQGFKQVGMDPATGWPICQAISKCEAPKVLAGVTADGDAYCRQPPSNNYLCNEYTTPSTGAVNCQPGERMKGVRTASECLVKNNVVVCDTMKIKCCKAK